MPHVESPMRRACGSLGSIALSCLLLIAAPREAGAQQAPLPAVSITHLSLEELGKIEVTTVDKAPETLLRSPVAIYVITQEDIRRSGATSLPDVLRLAPGINVARIDSGHWSVGVRGFGDQFSKSLLVLIDGRNVYTPLFAGIYWAVQDTLLQDIDRIEVIRGPGGTIWGANAVNGVINIITKDSADTAGLLVSAGGGTIEHSLGGFRYGSKGGAGFTYRVYGKTFNRGAQFHTDGHDFDDWHLGQSGFRTDWNGSADSLTIQGDVYKGSAGQSVVFGSLSPASDILSYDPVDLSGGNLLGSWRRQVGRAGDVNVQASYDRTYLLGPQIGETRNTFDMDFVHHLRPVRRQGLRWGLGLRISPSHVIQTVAGLDVLPHDQTNSIYSAFAEDEIALVSNRLSLTVGSKLEHNSYTGAEAQPNLRVLWTPTDRQSLWTAVTRAVRTPSRLEADIRLLRFLAATPPTFLQLVGNSEFKSERLLGYEAGYRIAIADQLFVDLSGFHNRHDDLESFGAGAAQVVTSPAPLHVLFVVPFANTIRGASNGAEITSDWKPARWWQLKGSYSYLHVELENTLGVPDIFKIVDQYEGSSPSHQFTIRPLLTLPKGWEIDQTYRYTSALPARAVKAYGTLDARVAWHVRSDLELAVVGQNLLQGHHLEFGHDPGPPVALKRGAYASFTWRR